MKTLPIGFCAVLIEKYFKIYMRNALKPFGLNMAEGMVLLCLGDKQGAAEEALFYAIHGKTQEQMIGELHYDKGVMARTMQALEQKGLVARSEHPQDLRSSLFVITAAGQRQQKMVAACFADWQEFVEAELSAEELAVVKSGLTRIAIKSIDHTKIRIDHQDKGGDI